MTARFEESARHSSTRLPSATWALALGLAAVLSGSLAAPGSVAADAGRKAGGSAKPSTAAAAEAAGSKGAAPAAASGRSGEAPREAAPPAPAAASGPGMWFPDSEGFFVPAFYDTFQGLDLTALSATQKERFVHWVNTELCTCAQTGCNRDTIANCYTNDRSCPRAPVRIREILDLVRRGASLPGSSAGRTPPPPTAPPR